MPPALSSGVCKIMKAPFQEIALLLAAAAAIGALAVRLRQPLILACIVVGILAGPVGLGLVTAHDPLDLLAQVGVAVLLFTVGLKLDLHLVRRLGAVALATGLGQLTFTILFGYLLALALGMDHLKAIYVAVALTFCSTIIIVKLLSDKKELDSLHGRIAVGFLIVQDIAVVIAMMAMSSLNMAEAGGVASTLGTIVLKLAVAGLLLAVAMCYVLPLSQVRWVVSALSDVGVNCALMAALRAHGYTGPVAVAAHSEADARQLKTAGVERVFHPYKDAADFAAEELQLSMQQNTR